MTDYRAELAVKAASVPSRIAQAKTLWKTWGPWIQKYRGGFPAGYAIAAMQWESGGNMNAAGDASLGEVGVFQVTASFPPTIGMPAASRYDAETNVFLGLTDYQVEAARFASQIPELELGTPDSWKLARLGFAVGHAGTLALVAQARALGLVRKGYVYGAVKDGVDRAGGIALGSQSADKVWYRVHTTELVWIIGQGVVAGAGDVPRLPPAPPGQTYQIPLSLLPYFHLTSRSSTIALVALAAAAIYLIKKLR